MVALDYLLQFIEDDAPFGDVTSASVIPDITCNAVIRAEQAGIIAGLQEVSILFSHFGVSVKHLAKDGDVICQNDILLLLFGDAKKILLVERTALNIIGRMSSIATQTRKMADIVSSVNPHCRVAATRKTCPGFQIFDKKAVQIGGGDPHRMNLSDGILIKDNHLALVPLKSAIRAAKKVSAYKKIEVEVETSDDALIAASAGADIVMLDNMSPDQVTQTITLLAREGLRDRILIELSGGITESSLKTYAALDVDMISLGFLTHSVSNFSVNLEIIPEITP
ncbi:MAG: carboxylating nicotinate-nucleotide diphosphorylase [Methanoregula sp.]|jgi:nicotinate-nucleotide pyrophosphorylase (carboxylating)|nr:carboxylating nicotinate-nucleotide diphosphorylase [Methanoregula sp.]